MSTREIESKVRELRQLQALIEEATQEAENIKDALKAYMGDSEELRAGEYSNYMEARQDGKDRHHGTEEGSAGRGGSLHPGDHRPPLLRGVEGGRGHADTYQGHPRQVSGLLLQLR